jgi:hypothetical protein
MPFITKFKKTKNLIVFEKYPRLLPLLDALDQ